MRRFFAFIIIGIAVLTASILFGQLLGGFYIYNLVVEDNPPVPEKKVVGTEVPKAPKRKVLRLEPIEFYTIQVGIFPEAKLAQKSIDQLVGLGLRPFVSSQPPYKIWVGCFSEINSGRDLEAALKNQGFEAFIGKGLINDRALKFPGDNKYMLDYFAPLLGKYDIIFNHSLKMFQSPKISAYKPEVWESMIKKIQSEVDDGLKSTDEILQLSDSALYQNDLQNLKEKGKVYREGLNSILASAGDEAVLSTQGNLLELIAAYHRLIDQTNEKLNANI